MELKTSSRIPTRVAINGKSFSPTYILGSEEDISKLLFSLFQRTHGATLKPCIELRIFAVRAVKEGDAQKTQYQANLLFPNDAIINYSYATPLKVHDIDRAFHVLGDQAVGIWRCLNFSAKEVILETGLGGVPPLYSERTEVDFARLINTAKNVNKIPNAVLEVKCLIGPHNPGLSRARDVRIADMERAVFAATPSPSSTLSTFGKATPSSSPSKSHSEAPKSYLTMDTLISKYKPKHEASQSSSTASTSRNGDSPAKTSFSSDEAKSSFSTNSKHGKSISAPQPKNIGNWRVGSEGSNMFQGISPSTMMGANTDKNKEKAVCFNCYAIGHREGECEAAKNKKMGTKTKRMTGLNIEKDVKDEKGEGKNEGTGPQWFCINCRKRGHTHWLCPQPKAKGI